MPQQPNYETMHLIYARETKSMATARKYCNVWWQNVVKVENIAVQSLKILDTFCIARSKNKHF